MKPAARRGAALVETALVLNIFFMVLFGVFEFGRFMMIRQLVENAARGAAREASAGTYAKTTADIQATAQRLLAGQQFSSAPVVSVYASDNLGNNAGAWDDAEFGNGIAVQIDADYRPMIPSFGILPPTVHLQAKSIMRSEGD